MFIYLFLREREGKRARQSVSGDAATGGAEPGGGGSWRAVPAGPLGPERWVTLAGLGPSSSCQHPVHLFLALRVQWEKGLSRTGKQIGRAHV